MADTVVHEHAGNDSSAASGIIIGVILFLFLALLIVFGIPFVRGVGSGSTTPQVNVPDKVDVNVQGGAK